MAEDQGSEPPLDAERQLPAPTDARRAPGQPHSDTDAHSANPTSEERQEFFAELALRISSHSGPLPHPEFLEAYEKAVPGSGKIIVKMAKDGATHRQEINRAHIRFQRRALELKARESLLGQIFAFALALVVLGGGLVLLGLDKSLGGLGSIITAAVALVSVFIAGKLLKGESNNRDEHESAESGDAVDEKGKRPSEKEGSVPRRTERS